MDLQQSFKQALLVNSSLENAYIILNFSRQIFKSSFQVKCAWCDKELRKGHDVFGVSHGMCKNCFDKQEVEIERLTKNNK